MTVIVWDGATLAADGRITKEDTIISDDAVKITVCGCAETIHGEKVLAFGVSGDLGCECQLLSKIKTGLTHTTTFTKPTGIYAIIVSEKSTYEFFKTKGDDECVICRVTSQTAMGSGGSVAQVLLSLGFNAENAVKGTIERVSSCGGKITSWSRDDALPETT